MQGELRRSISWGNQVKSEEDWTELVGMLLHPRAVSEATHMAWPGPGRAAWHRTGSMRLARNAHGAVRAIRRLEALNRMRDGLAQGGADRGLARCSPAARLLLACRQEEGDGDADGDACTSGVGGVRAPDGASRVPDGASSDATASEAAYKTNSTAALPPRMPRGS